jgi:hypothetical protein
VCACEETFPEHCGVVCYPYRQGIILYLEGKMKTSAIQAAPTVGARRGWMARFSAKAVVDGNRRHYESFVDVFISPHDPAKEFQSMKLSDLDHRVSLQRFVDQFLNTGHTIYEGVTI